MITEKLLHNWEACWTATRITTYFGKRKSFTPRKIAADKTISPSDRLWVLSKCIEHLDPAAARLFAIECAASVTHLAGDEYNQAQHAGLLAWLIEITEMPESEQSAVMEGFIVAALEWLGDYAEGWIE